MKKNQSPEMIALLKQKDSLCAMRGNAKGKARQILDTEITEVRKAIELEKKKPKPLGKVVQMESGEANNRQRFGNYF